VSIHMLLVLMCSVSAVERRVAHYCQHESADRYVIQFLVETFFNNCRIIILMSSLRSNELLIPKNVLLIQL